MRERDGMAARAALATVAGTAAATPARRFDRWAGDPNFMLSLARGMLALQTVTEAAGRPISARGVAAATGLPVAAAGRCLYTLDALGYVRANRNGAIPGPAFAALAAAAQTGASPLLWGCGPVLDRLRDACDAAISLAAFDGDAPVIAASSSPAAILRLDLPVGAALPLHSTSAGKLYLASLDRAALARRLATLELPALTARTITDRAALGRAVAAAARHGHAISDGEQVAGIRTIAVPVRDAHGRARASLNAATIGAAMPLRDLRGRVLPALAAAADELSALLG